MYRERRCVCVYVCVCVCVLERGRSDRERGRGGEREKDRQAEQKGACADQWIGNDLPTTTTIAITTAPSSSRHIHTCTCTSTHTHAHTLTPPFLCLFLARTLSLCAPASPPPRSVVAIADVQLLAQNWRTVMMCGLLLASKVRVRQGTHPMCVCAVLRNSNQELIHSCINVKHPSQVYMVPDFIAPPSPYFIPSFLHSIIFLQSSPPLISARFSHSSPLSTTFPPPPTTPSRCGRTSHLGTLNSPRSCPSSRSLRSIGLSDSS